MLRDQSKIAASPFRAERAHQAQTAAFPPMNFDWIGALTAKHEYLKVSSSPQAQLAHREPPPFTARTSPVNTPLIEICALATTAPDAS